MQYKKLGNSSLEIAPLVFGGNVFGWTLNEQESFALLDALVDQGINMIDTANVYSVWVDGHQGGESETIIGNWLKKTGKRDKIILATKGGQKMGDGSCGLSKENIIQSVEDSLKRLKTDHIDLYYAHVDDPTVPLEDTLEIFSKLMQEGKIQAIASSNYSAERLQEAMTRAKERGYPSFIAHQPEYNLFDRKGYEASLEQVCQREHLGVVTYFSLASGFLSGKYRNTEDLVHSKRGAAFLEKYMTARGVRILSALEGISQKYGVTMAAVALAWIMERPTVTAPIVSATSKEQLLQLLAAVTLDLQQDDMALLNNASEEM